jgi:hypothetical protein
VLRFDRGRAAAADVPDTDAGDYGAAVGADILGQGKDSIHGIDLGLSTEAHCPVDREREAGVPHIIHLDPGGESRRQFLAQGLGTLWRGGVGISVTFLVREIAGLQIPQQPGLPFPVCRDVRVDNRRGVLAPQR